MSPEQSIIDGAVEFACMRQILSEESAAAAGVIHGLLYMDTVPSRPPSRAWISAGMVFELTAAVARTVSEMPERSAQLAHLATAIASALDHTYPAITRALCTADAWAVVADVRRRQNGPDSALEALDVADRALEAYPGSVQQQCVLALIRAEVYVDLRRTADALHLVNAVRPFFEMQGDEQLITKCELLAGIIAHFERREGARAPVQEAHPPLGGPQQGMLFR